MTRQNRNAYIVFANISFCGFFCSDTLLDKLVLEIYLDLFTVFTVFSVSVLLVDLDLSNDLTFSDLLLLDVSNFLLDACDLSFLLTVSILFYAI